MHSTKQSPAGFAWREGFFGPNFVGCVPHGYALKGKDAATQMATLVKTWDHSTFDVTYEISANRKSVYLNSLFWAQHDFSEVGVSRQQRDDFISHLKKLWEFNHVDAPLPGRGGPKFKANYMGGDKCYIVH